MSSVRRLFAWALAVLLSLEAFGPSAWAQVAARASAASPGPVVPFVGYSSFGGYSAGPAFLSPTALSLSPLPAPAAPVPTVQAAALVVPVRAEVPLKAGLSTRVGVLAQSTAPALERVLAAASSRTDLRRSGEDLEGILSGELPQ
ncbi:MAG: hypothetical protein ABL955_15770, partial [Elusimicrobiota bacterium]